ncbi:hypothetical protein GO986_20690 [Deinococcus sp. HMF7620]|uniref:Uncharacterized protein n=1 Tax=Deinococcus arboris TaxID=2682977 RepID=A0A7C9LPW8_9DEIO|nr:hypothetical protein [Deinococcus arboris]MVN89157.1 hypothetical protein [Deinococcus arboris]
MARFVNPAQAPLLGDLADNMFKALHDAFEVHLQQTCRALLPGFKDPKGNKAAIYLETLNKQLGGAVIDSGHATIILEQCRRRHAVTREGEAPREPVRPAAQAGRGELFDALPFSHQHAVQALATLLSATAHIDQAARGQVQGAEFSAHQNLFGAEPLPETWAALDLSAAEVLRYPQVLRMLRRALPDGWALPLPVTLEHIVLFMQFWAAQHVPDGEVLLVGLGTPLLGGLSCGDVIFTLTDDPDALKNTTFTEEGGWGAVWFPDGRAAFWPLTELPERVAATSEGAR